MATNPSEKLIALLNSQISMEFANHNAYLALAAWCDDRSLSGLSSFYRGQAYEEYMHAMLIYTWMLEWDLPIQMLAIPEVQVEAQSVIELTEIALKYEEGTTDAIHAIYTQADEEKAWALKDAFTWFVSEQVEEMSVAKENVDRARLSGESGAALLEFDREIGGKASKPSPLPGGSSTST